MGGKDKALHAVAVLSHDANVLKTVLVIESKKLSGHGLGMTPMT